EAEMLIECGVEYLGFPLRLDVHAPDLSEDEAQYVIKKIRGRCKPVLITYLSRANEISQFMKFLNTTYVQLHGPIEIAELEKLKKENLFIIKSLVVKANNEARLIEDVKKFETLVSAFITDTFDSQTGASGATGKTHDWNISRHLVENSSIPVILAGGIR